MGKRFKRFYSLMFINAIIIFNISSCTGYNKVSEKPDQAIMQMKIGVAMYDAQDTFIQSVYSMMEHYANQEAAAGNVEIELTIADAQNNQQIQIGQIEAFINEEYDAIAINIVDRAQASTIINKAQKANIPLVFFNREPVPQDMYIWDKVYYVGAKAEQSGKLQAELLMTAIEQGLEVDTNGDGIIQYVMLEGEPGHQDAILRTYYSIKVLEENNYKLENIASDTGMWRREESKEKMLGWIEAFGEKIELVIANNDAMAMGAIEALDEKGYFNKPNKIQVIGVDGMEKAIQAIKEERMLGTVFNNADTQGEAILAKIYTMIMEKEPEIIVNAEYEEKCFHTNYEIMDKDFFNKYKT